MPSTEDPQEPKRAGRHSQITAYLTAGVLVIALVGALVVVVIVGGTETSEPAMSFNPDYSDLEARRQAAGVSTMGEPADAEAHLHPRLELWANGEQVPIPVNIGIDPAQSPQAMASLHTHESDGTIHVEGMADATLGQFFEIWGVPLSADQLGPYEVQGLNELEMRVDGQPSSEFENLKLADGQEIVIAYGTPEERAKAQ